MVKQGGWVIHVMKLTLTTRYDLVDILLDSEYFASLCGFEYPNSDLDDSKIHGSMKLVSEVNRKDNDKRLIYGLMVWQNKSYIPVIDMNVDDEVLMIKIKNKKELPYPVIKRTEAWLMGLMHYLTSKLNNENVEEIEKESVHLYNKEINKTLV